MVFSYGAKYSNDLDMSFTAWVNLFPWTTRWEDGLIEISQLGIEENSGKNWDQLESERFPQIEDLTPSSIVAVLKLGIETALDAKLVASSAKENKDPIVWRIPVIKQPRTLH